jgi:hypothetical protein
VPPVQNDHDSALARGGWHHYSSATCTSDAPTTSEMRSPVASPVVAPAPKMGPPSVQQPLLKKKRSIIDRFRGVSREPPNPGPQPQYRPAFIYVPTHAASDFSRIVVSPRGPPRHQLPYAYDEHRTDLRRGGPLDTIIADSSEDEPECAVPSPQRRPAPQTLVEKPISPRAASPVKDMAWQEMVSPVNQKSLRSPRRSNPPITESRETSQAAVPVTAAPGECARGPSRASNNAPTDETLEPVLQQPTAGHASSTAVAVDGAQNQQLSDYELFIARAEAKERAYREQLLRDLPTMTVTPSGHIVPYRDPRPESENLSPYRRHSATYTANISAGSTAVAGASDQPGTAPRKTLDGRVSVGDSGIGSQSSRAGGRAKRETEEVSNGLVPESPWDPKSRKHASWEQPPSLAARNDAQQQILARRPAALVPPEADDGLGDNYTGVPGPVPGPNLARDKRGILAQQARTLRKQASFRQRIGEYIKPSRRPSRYGNAGHAARLAQA